jgi:hypothetical protein
MYDPRRLTTLWAFTAWYRDRFSFNSYLAVKLIQNRIRKHSMPVLSFPISKLVQFDSATLNIQRHPNGRLSDSRQRISVGCQFALIFPPMHKTNTGYFEQNSKCEADFLISVRLCLQIYPFNQRNDGVRFSTELLLNL